MTMKNHKYRIISTYLHSIINSFFSSLLFIKKTAKKKKMMFVIDLTLPYKKTEKSYFNKNKKRK